MKWYLCVILWVAAFQSIGALVDRRCEACLKELCPQSPYVCFGCQIICGVIRPGQLGMELNTLPDESGYPFGLFFSFCSALTLSIVILICMVQIVDGGD